MPQAIPAAAAAAWKAAVSWVATPLVGVLGEGAAIAVASATLQFAAYSTISLGLGAVARSQVPSTEGQKSTRKQPRPERYYAIGGPARVSAAFTLGSR